MKQASISKAEATVIRSMAIPALAGIEQSLELSDLPAALIALKAQLPKGPAARSLQSAADHATMLRRHLAEARDELTRLAA